MNINNNVYSYYQNNINDKYRKYNFFYNGQLFSYSSSDYIDKFSNIQKELLLNDNFYNKTLHLTLNIKLSKKEIVQYFYPEIEYIKDDLCLKIDVNPEDNYVEYIENSCKINYIYGNKGLFLDQEYFYNEIFNNIINNQKIINIKIKTNYYENENDIKNDFTEKSCFETNFSSSSESRKNNIITALKCFDGIVLEEGEILSFNKVTGFRNEKSGYQKAKIISGGTFIDGYGGGVCQVSSTLYNAFLLAGLEIIEVHNHSLPVSYVEPCFDAMVNSGSSDLIVRNNTNGKIIITTSSKNNICKVKIFGKKNKYKIKKISEKIKELPAESDYIEYDYKKYGDIKLEIGEEKRISYAKDGFISNGYVVYYDLDEKYLKKEKIRECKYNPTKGIIVKRVI